MDFDEAIKRLKQLYRSVDKMQESIDGIITETLGKTMRERYINAKGLEKLFIKHGLINHCKDIRAILWA